ncbi:MAG: hypothetical protein ACYTXY_13670 [Nostoc sp.]
MTSCQISTHGLAPSLRDAARTGKSKVKSQNYQGDAYGGLRLRKCTLDHGATKLRVPQHDIRVPQHDI